MPGYGISYGTKPTDVFNAEATNRLRMAIAVQSGRISEAMANQMAPGWEAAAGPQTIQQRWSLYDIHNMQPGAVPEGYDVGPSTQIPGAGGPGSIGFPSWTRTLTKRPSGMDPLVAVYGPGALPLPPQGPGAPALPPPQPPTPAGGAAPVPPPPSAAPFPSLVPPPSPAPIAIPPPAPLVPPTVPAPGEVPGLPLPAPPAPSGGGSLDLQGRLAARDQPGPIAPQRAGPSPTFPGIIGSARMRIARSAVMDPVKRRALVHALSS